MRKKDMRENQELKQEYPDAFIVEHLTPLRSKVAYRLRQAQNIEKCWTIDGRLKIVLQGAQAADKPITVDSLSQLTRIPGWTKEDIKKLVFEAWNYAFFHGKITELSQGLGIRNNSGPSEYEKPLITYCKYALIYLNMLKYNTSFLHFIKCTHVYTFVIILSYLNMPKYKFPMLIYLRYRISENNYKNFFEHSCNFPFIIIQMIHFYSIVKIQISYKNSYRTNRTKWKPTFQKLQ